MRVCGWAIAGVVVAFVCTPVQAAPPLPRGADARTTPTVNGEGPEQGPDAALRTAGDLEPLRLPAFIPGQDDMIRLHETSGAAVTLRVTPVDEEGRPVDGGRVILLRRNERRAVHLTDTLPFEDLIGRRLVIETLGGTGEVEIEATWVTPAEAVAVAPALHIPRRHLTGATRPTSEALIDQAVAAGTLDPETALVYKAFALFGDARLPAQYRGNDTVKADSLELDEIRAAAPTMSPANQALVQPFLIPPIYKGSWATGLASGSVRALNVPPPCSDPDPNWSWLESSHGWVRVWFRPDHEGDAATAQSIIDAVEGTIWSKFIGLMVGHAPLPDDTESCDGGSGTLDMYLTELPPRYYGMTCAYRPGGAPTPAYILLQRNADLATVAHELFHAFQDSYQRLAGLTDERYQWWTEASAEWSEDFVYPGGSGIDQRHDDAHSFLADPEQPLDLVDMTTLRHYGAYLVPFYVYRKTGSAAFVAQSWANCARQPALEALDAALPGGFAAIWPEVALHDWNSKPVDQYFKWDGLSWTARPSGGAVVSVDLGGALDSELKLKVDLPRLSATYKSFVFPPNGSVRSVAFWNGASYDLEKQNVPTIGPLWNPTTASDSARKGVKVQALVKVAGADWTVEDWTDRPYVEYCQDLTAERLEYLVIIISNSEFSDRGRHVTPPGEAPRFWASKIGCWQWKGTATYTAPVSGSTQTDTADVTWTRVSAQPDSFRVTYQASGTVTVAMSGGCSGGGTVPISGSATSMESYNFTPADSAARASYKGQAVDQTMVSITCQGKPGKTLVGPWFQILAPQPPQFPFYRVSDDGATMNFTYNLSGITWHWDLHAQRQ
jgi:hypothetical protein